MGEHRADGEELVASLRACGEYIQGCVLLGFSKDPLLAASAIVECEYDVRRLRLVGREDFILINRVPWLEQMELEWALDLLGPFRADEDEPIRLVPGHSLMSLLKYGGRFVDGHPALSSLDVILENGDAQERHGTGEFSPCCAEGFEYGVAVEGRIHAGFHPRLWHLLQGLGEALRHEFRGPLGVVHVAWAVVHVEELPRLGHGAEQRVVAACRTEGSSCALPSSPCCSRPRFPQRDP